MMKNEEGKPSKQQLVNTVMTVKSIYQDIWEWAEISRIEVSERLMDRGKAGEFNGVSITLNARYATVEKSYYLVHALGSIVRWSLSHEEVQAIFDELRDAKKADDRIRIEPAIESYRRFEIESSEFAVWLLAELGHTDIVPSYTNFMRADLEALTVFHRTGHAPVWQDFFRRWNAEVDAGQRQILPFNPKECSCLPNAHFMLPFVAVRADPSVPYIVRLCANDPGSCVGTSRRISANPR